MSAADLTLAELRTEFFARGFDFIDNSRATYWINRAYDELCEEQDWPFLEATTTGLAPLTIADLRTIESVVDSTTLTKLVPVARQIITDQDPTLATTGSPTYYYITSGTTVSVYPVNTTDSLSVRYWKLQDDLSSSTDKPLVPNRFRLVLIDGALIHAYRDRDNFEAAAECAAMFEEGKARMRDSLLTQQHDLPDQYVITSYWDD